MLIARRVSSFAISKSWAHTPDRPQFPNRSRIRARSLSIVSTTGPGLRINFSRSDDTGGDLLDTKARSDETDAAASFRARSGEIESPLRRHARACRGHPRLSCGSSARKTWMAGTSPAMTAEKWQSRGTGGELNVVYAESEHRGATVP